MSDDIAAPAISRWKDRTSKRRRFLWQLHYMANMTSLALSYFGLSVVVFDVIAERDPLITYVGNLVTILLMLAVNEWALRFSHRPHRKPRRRWTRMLVWFFIADEDTSLKPGLYFFYIAVLITGRIAAYTPDWHLSEAGHRYLDIMSVTFLLMVALDKFIDEYLKSARRARHLIEHTRELDNPDQAGSPVS